MKLSYNPTIIERDIEVKKATIQTLDFQIKSLKDFTNPAQLSIWRKRRAMLNKELKELKIRFELLQK